MKGKRVAYHIQIKCQNRQSTKINSLPKFLAIWQVAMRGGVELLGGVIDEKVQLFEIT